MVSKIKAIPEKRFYSSTGGGETILEAYVDDCTYYINIATEVLRDEYYEPHTADYQREENGWNEDKEWMKNYFLDNINEIETIEQ